MAFLKRHRLFLYHKYLQHALMVLTVGEKREAIELESSAERRLHFVLEQQHVILDNHCVGDLFLGLLWLDVQLHGKRFGIGMYSVVQRAWVVQISTRLDSACRSPIDMWSPEWFQSRQQLSRPILSGHEQNG